MTTTIPDLWSDDIKVSVLPPIAVLKAQVGFFARKTQGMLEAKLSTVSTAELVQHQLDLIAPSLNSYRERLLSATHHQMMPYPVIVSAACFDPKPASRTTALTPLATATVALAAAASRAISFGPMMSSGIAMEWPMELTASQRKAATYEEFIALVREVLQSVEVQSLIDSLIARINQDKDTTRGNGAVQSSEDTNSSEKQGN